MTDTLTWLNSFLAYNKPHKRIYISVYKMGEMCKIIRGKSDRFKKKKTAF